jgi:hypothetical protein
MPSNEKPTGRSLSPPPYDNNRALVSFALNKLHENINWLHRLFPPEISLDAGVETTNSYIIFIWPEHNDTDVVETLRDQVETRVVHGILGKSSLLLQLTVTVFLPQS